MTKRIFRDPLAHFLIVGLVLYVLFGTQPEVSEDTIEVTPATLLPMLVASVPAISLADVPAYLNSMNPEQRDQLIEQYIREEVLVREARAMGLEQEDAFLRKRLVSQLEYIADAFAEETSQIPQTEMLAWYEANRDEYQEPEQVSFTHVFLAESRTQDGAAHAQAQRLKKKLDDERIPAFKGPAYGDHFLFHRNYVESDHREIAAHFGSGFADLVFAAEPAPATWQGPWRSDHGWHLVLLSEHTQSFLPPLTSLEKRIGQDIMAERRFEARQDLYQAARSRYRIVVDIQAPPANAD